MIRRNEEQEVGREARAGVETLHATHKTVSVEGVVGERL